MPQAGSSHPPSDPELAPGTRAARRAWRVMLGATIYWLGALVALHLLDTGLDPIRRPVSSYLNTDARPLATTWFLALGLIVASSTVWLRAVTRPGVPRALGSGIFALVAMGILLAGMTPTGLSPLHRRLHMIGGLLTFPPLVVGTWLWTAALLGSGARSARRYLLVLFAAGITAALAVGVTYGESQELGGLFQRALFVCLLGWLVVGGSELGRVAPADVDRA